MFDALFKDLDSGNVHAIIKSRVDMCIMYCVYGALVCSEPRVCVMSG